MKHLILTFLIGFSFYGFSQKIHIGPELGFNLINVQTQKIGNNFQPGWHTGGSFKYDFTNWFSLKSGIYYTQKRQQYISFDTTLSPLIALIGADDIEGVDFKTYSETNGRHSLNFVQLPVMGSFNYENFSVNIGGYFGFMFSSRTKELKESITPFVSTIDLSILGETGGVLGSFLLPPANKSVFTESSNSSSLSTIDYGLKIGIGYTENNFDLNLSYLLGLKDYRTSSLITEKQVNKYFQFSIAYLFNLGRKTNNSRFS